MIKLWRRNLSDRRKVYEFQKGKECGDESFIIPTSLFEIAKPLIFVEIPYCELNEIKTFFEESSQIHQQ